MRVDGLVWTAFAMALARAAEPSGFAGAAACARCHKEIYARQEASHHARSLRPPAEIPEISSRLPVRFQAAEVTLEMVRGGPDELHLRAGGLALKLGWAFGSGAKGITPVGTHDGEFRESRLSWYRSTESFALTPGATAFTPKSPADQLGRPLTNKEVKECFTCHTTGYTPDQPAPARNEMGIRCESCHGPGAAHAAAPGKQIRHPGRMDALSQIRLCGNCHGRTPSDTDLAAIRAIEANPNTVRFPSTRLVLSRCYNESPEGLKCSQCHNAHGNVAGERARFDSACSACHTCPKASKDCSSCHMPKERIMVQSEFTDHWIRVVRRRP